MQWIDVNERLPYERDMVYVRVKGETRADYYRIGDRWYSMRDIDRWKMKTSPYWRSDRAWYVKTERVEAWAPMVPEDDRDTSEAAQARHHESA